MSLTLFQENSRLQRALAYALLTAYLPSAMPVVLATQPEFFPGNSGNATSGDTGGVFEPAPLPAPVRTASEVRVNPTLPAGVSSPREVVLPSQPTDAELIAYRLFAEPLTPSSSRSDAAENAALALALRDYERDGCGENVSALRSFLAGYPEGRWTASLRLNLGLKLFSHCRFSDCFGEFRAAWDLSKAASAGAMRSVADRAMAELLRLNARIGRVDTLEPLFKECGDRVFTGPSSELVSGARLGFWRMKNTPGQSFRCGSLALDRIYAYQKGVPTAHVPELLNADSPPTGFALTAVRDMAAKAGLRFRMAFRSPGAALITPAVLNWKVGHYAAVLTEKDGVARLQDPTFPEFSLTATRETIDAEASGYFLIPDGPLPEGWRAVTDAEGAKVFGKGDTQGPIPDSTGAEEPTARPKGKDCGMAVYNAQLMVCGLNLSDTPLWYAPAFGPSVAFSLTYNQREASQPSTFDFGNVGPKWLNNWTAYIDETRAGSPGARVFTTVMRPKGGGTKRFPDQSSSAEDLGAVSFGREFRSHAELVKTDAATYKFKYNDGSVATYGFRTGAAGTRRYFLSAETDPSGNSVAYAYDAQSRLIAVTDAAGLVTTLTYDDAARPLLLTKVTDPFGRFATIAYDASGRVLSLTDMMGITSSFGYRGGSDFIETLTTPYGVSRFDFGENGADRWLAMTDAEGATEFLEYKNQTAGITSGQNADSRDPIAPTGFESLTQFNQYIDRRNSCFWGKKAYAKSGMDYHTSGRNYAYATIYHWLHTGVNSVMTSPILESVKQPGENRVWFAYEGQTWALGEGTSSNVRQVARVLPDGSTQLKKFSFTAEGNPSVTLDPLGRATRFRYAANAVDVVGVDACTAGDPLSGGATWTALSSSTYDAAHHPLTVTDSAGLTTSFTYNGRGQPLTITAPDGRVTSFTYNTGSGTATAGRVTGVVTSIPGGTPRSATTTYDGFGRPRTVTDPDGYAVTYDYDNFGRVTLVTYPDATTVQSTYDKLDLSASKDRAGRITRYTNNALRQVSRVVDPLGRTTLYNWCRCGALQDLTDPMGRVTHWDYDTQAARPCANSPTVHNTRPFTMSPVASRPPPTRWGR